MANESFVLRIKDWPEQQDARELLELVLAGASLGLELDVVFEEMAVAFLESESARPWRQLLDHDLARLWYCGDPVESDRQALPATRLDAHQRDHLLDGRVNMEL